MVWIIIIGVMVAAVVGWAFWPHKRGVVDEDFRKRRWTNEGRGGYFGG